MPEKGRPVGRPFFLSEKFIRSTDLMGTHSGWIAVSGSSDLAAMSARAVVMPDHDVVIWRSKSGNVQAWENRCPHRGMRMSFGQVREDRLVCRYHGWGFDKKGQCQSIPAAPDMTAPPTACIKTYACVEDGDLIWVNTSDDAADKPSADQQLFCKSIYVDGERDDLLEKLSSARFLPYGGKVEDGIEWSSEGAGDGVIHISAKGKTDDVLTIAVHQADKRRCGIHITASAGASDEENNKRRLHYSGWAKTLRWHLSNPGAASDGFRIFD
jgi:nitrite reductase/ring-hydroxylating ferredoxin subunit